MRRIVILNPKGGCGKSTIATNLAGLYASQKQPTALLDLDPQQSSMDWLQKRSNKLGNIIGASGDLNHMMMPHGKGALIIDTPASIHGKALKPYVKVAHTMIIPVLPSPMDMRATARFVEDILLIGRINRDKVRLAVVANRVDRQTVIYRRLKKFLNALDIPFIAIIRESQNYIRAAQKGESIFDMRPSDVSKDLSQWKPLIKWLNSSDSMPKGKIG